MTPTVYYSILAVTAGCFLLLLALLAFMIHFIYEIRDDWIKHKAMQQIRFQAVTDLLTGLGKSIYTTQSALDEILVAQFRALDEKESNPALEELNTEIPINVGKHSNYPYFVEYSKRYKGKKNRLDKYLLSSTPHYLGQNGEVIHDWKEITGEVRYYIGHAGGDEYSVLLNYGDLIVLSPTEQFYATPNQTLPVEAANGYYPVE